MVKFITVRDLRSKSAQVWRELGEERELVLTNNGKPIAIVSATDEESFEQSLREIRQARATRAVKQLQERAMADGQDELSTKDVESEITTARKGRRR